MRHSLYLLPLTIIILMGGCGEGIEEESISSAQGALVISPAEANSAVQPLDDLENLSGEDMRNALYKLVQGHRSLGYKTARLAMFVASKGGVDIHNNQIECIYTGRQVAANKSNVPTGYNAEHSWPQSKGATSEPAKSDLHHLFPATASANSRRGNMPFGETDCVKNNNCRWQDGGSIIGPSSTGSGYVFYVRPERQGDIARAQFYFSLRYKQAIPDETEKVLRRWNKDDPVDVEELDRDLAIGKLQNNSNPFIYRPEFVEHIANF